MQATKHRTTYKNFKINCNKFFARGVNSPLLISCSLGKITDIKLDLQNGFGLLKRQKINIENM